MKIKYVLAFFLVLPLVVYSYWLASIEKQVSSAKEFFVTMKGYNLVDLLNEHYLMLRPDWENTDCTQFDEGRCPTELFAYSYRYYLSELATMDIDAENVRDLNIKVEIGFAVKGKANPQVKNLYINGQHWKDWFSQFVK